MRRGEVKIAQELRQRCPKLWLEMQSHPWQYPRISQGQANLAMERLSRYIGKNFYGEKCCEFDVHSYLNKIKSIRVENDHEKDECEACQLYRCPRIWKTLKLNDCQDQDGYNYQNIQTFPWVLLDEHNHTFHIL